MFSMLQKLAVHTPLLDSSMQSCKKWVLLFTPIVFQLYPDMPAWRGRTAWVMHVSAVNHFGDPWILFWQTEKYDQGKPRIQTQTISKGEQNVTAPTATHDPMTPLTTTEIKLGVGEAQETFFWIWHHKWTALAI